MDDTQNGQMLRAFELFVAILNKLFNKESNSRLYETASGSFETAIMMGCYWSADWFDMGCE